MISNCWVKHEPVYLGAFRLYPLDLHHKDLITFLGGYQSELAISSCRWSALSPKLRSLVEDHTSYHDNYLSWSFIIYSRPVRSVIPIVTRVSSSSLFLLGLAQSTKRLMTNSLNWAFLRTGHPDYHAISSKNSIFPINWYQDDDALIPEPCSGIGTRKIGLPTINTGSSKAWIWLSSTNSGTFNHVGTEQ